MHWLEMARRGGKLGRPQTGFCRWPGRLDHFLVWSRTLGMRFLASPGPIFSAGGIKLTSSVKDRVRMGLPGLANLLGYIVWSTWQWAGQGREWPAFLDGACGWPLLSRD